MEQVFELIERPSTQIKELRLLYENSDNTGIYKIFTKWLNDPTFDDYIRIIYSNEDEVDGLDFDGGPMIYPGYQLDKHNKIVKIYRDKNTKEFLVKIENTAE